VLDPLFKPVPAEKDLFEAKQKYMYAVFERVLQTDKGKALVSSNEADANAQKIFNEPASMQVNCVCCFCDKATECHCYHGRCHIHCRVVMVFTPIMPLVVCFFILF